ncbi:MAG: acyl-CoA thioesterase [Spirochaetaceae bacterium]|jgi:acyl-CoA thioester hydrolase|nr:acyl-CoA thioesterase [Spirochaetaceae bacterium]
MFTTTVTPRFGDVDGLGHINNVVLAAWFELARNPLFRIFEPDLNLSHNHWPLIMAHTEYDFTDQLFFQYDVELRTFVERVGTKSFTLYHEAWQQGRLCSVGRAVIVHFDFLRNQSTPIPEDKKRLLEEHLRLRAL